MYFFLILVLIELNWV